MNFLKLGLLSALICCAFIAGCGSEAAPTKPIALNKSFMALGLPLTGEQSGQSDNGHARSRWQIVGADSSVFDVTGNNPSDADLVSWKCQVFDSQGSRLPSAASNSFCKKFFVQVLSKVVSNPDATASELLGKANPQQTSDQMPTLRLADNDILIQTDSVYFFIRRISRM